MYEWIKKNWKIVVLGACIVAFFAFDGISGCASRRRTERYLLESLEHIRAAAESQREVLEYIRGMEQQFSDITAAVGNVGADVGKVIEENRQYNRGYDELRSTILGIGEEIRADADLYSELGDLSERGLELLDARPKEAD